MTTRFLFRMAAGVPAAIVLLAASTSAAQTPAKGPIVPDFGPVYAVPAPGLATPLATPLKVSFDVALGADDPAKVNPRIETAARFLNMHGQAGVPAANLGVAVVLHGTAGKDALSHEAYRKRFGVDNPNLALIEALVKAGGRVYLCGQTAGSRGLGFDEIAPPVKLALSAMTAHLVLQQEGFRLNPF